MGALSESRLAGAVVVTGRGSGIGRAAALAVAGPDADEGRPVMTAGRRAWTSA
jgi:NAD(P)-dependent dehydrogenase (short-subunit alcohol dehydrogenase family)